jgi:hypothetical protein
MIQNILKEYKYLNNLKKFIIKSFIFIFTLQLFVTWIVFSVIATCYSYIWDLKMDW